MIESTVYTSVMVGYKLVARINYCEKSNQNCKKIKRKIFKSSLKLQSRKEASL